jgi:hypothetical protein
MHTLPPKPPPPIVVTDPRGDSGTAPDITKVRVVTGAKGRISFIVVFATPYGNGSSLYVYLGADSYRLGPGGLEVWDPPADDFEPLGSESGTFSVAPGGRALEVSTQLASIGNPKSLVVVVQSLDGDGGSGQVDTARLRWTRGPQGRSP